MTDVAALKRANAARWADMHLHDARIHGFDAVAKHLVAPAAKARYLAIQQGTGVPWWVIAVIHERESGQDFTTHLGQGDPLNRVTVNEPAGRGPFFNHPGDAPLHDAFYRGAIDALMDCAPHASRWGDWSVGGVLTLLEAYNGYGYAGMHQPSPYVWSGTDQYHAGKYIRDHVYDPTAVDVQDGCAPLIARMMVLDPSIHFGAQAIPPPIIKPPQTFPAPAPSGFWATLVAAFMRVFK